MGRIIEILSYFICYTFNILRVRKYVVYPNGEVKRANLTIIPDTIYDKTNNKYFNVVSIVSETINNTMVYYYIKVEEFTNNLNNNDMK